MVPAPMTGKLYDTTVASAALCARPSHDMSGPPATGKHRVCAVPVRSRQHIPPRMRRMLASSAPLLSGTQRCRQMAGFKHPPTAPLTACLDANGRLPDSGGAQPWPVGAAFGVRKGGCLWRRGSRLQTAWQRTNRRPLTSALRVIPSQLEGGLPADDRARLREASRHRQTVAVRPKTHPGYRACHSTWAELASASSRPRCQ